VARCLAALLAQEDPVDEVLVVDQSADGRTEAVCRAAGAEVRHIADPGRGLSHAHNVGIAAAAGDVIACIDDDCYAARDWSRCLREVLTRHPDADGVFGEMVAPTAASVGPDRISVSTIYFDGEQVHRGRRPSHHVGYGGNMALRRDAWRRLGPRPCDERLGAGTRNPGADDMDVIFRVLRDGGTLVSASSVRVVHDQWRPRDVLVRQMYGYGRGAGAWLGMHLAARDPYAARLVVGQLGADLKFIASGVRRRSRLRLAAGAARLAGTLRGLAAGVAMRPWEHVGSHEAA
jgi:glycosyltransferase involved in cell wall biosynthesis